MKQKNLLFLAISVFIVIVFWIVADLYNKAATSTIGDVLSIQIQPITPDFDSVILERLRKRTKVIPVKPAPISPTPSEASEAAILEEPVLTPEPGLDDTGAASVGGENI